ncbi:IclR family transcriptional regulator [Rhodococcus baikonurensis]
MDNSTPSVRRVKSTDRTVDVLELLARRQPLGLGDLADALAIPKSSLHGVMRTLESRGWVEENRDSQQFRLGLGAVLVGNSFLQQDEVVAATAGSLEWLVDHTGETAQLARLEGTEVVYLAKRQSTHAVSLVSTIGGRLPAHATALGKALLSTRTTEELDRLLSFPLKAMTAHTRITRDDLYEDLALTRSRGYAAEEGEVADGLVCFAVALPWSRPTVDAVSVSIPSFRASPKRGTGL